MFTPRDGIGVGWIEKWKVSIIKIVKLWGCVGFFFGPP